MEFQDFLCDLLKDIGDVKAKKMFGTYNICLNGINLGLVCQRKWYLKKTPAGDAFIAANNLMIETGIKNNSYILYDFSDTEKVCGLVRVTHHALKQA
ncbi:MAG: TfoX/Sxy family protein [Clostridia bacterium]|nr:TfoX/Sxy family protein [Clostridia bacterium]